MCYFFCFLDRLFSYRFRFPLPVCRKKQFACCFFCFLYQFLLPVCQKKKILCWFSWFTYRLSSITVQFSLAMYQSAVIMHWFFQLIYLWTTTIIQSTLSPSQSNLSTCYFSSLAAYRKVIVQHALFITHWKRQNIPSEFCHWFTFTYKQIPPIAPQIWKPPISHFKFVLAI